MKFILGNFVMISDKFVNTVINIAWDKAAAAIIMFISSFTLSLMYAPIYTAL